MNIATAGTRHGEVFRLELSPSILELCDRAATKVVWVTVSVAARSGDIGNLFPKKEEDSSNSIPASGGSLRSGTW